MRVWDVHPGYLNRQSLLGEHREIHAVLSVIINHKAGYARHPETVRWRGSLGALALRHDMVVAEMRFRGYGHRSPVICRDTPQWPGTFIDPPWRQFVLLEGKYRFREQGRIPLPRTTRQLWAQHKYSVLARDPELYRAVGREAAHPSDAQFFRDLSGTLVEALRARPPQGRLVNAVLHLWGYVSGKDGVPPGGDPAVIMAQIQQRARSMSVGYLLESTAMTDLAFWAQKRPCIHGDETGQCLKTKGAR
ncbi:MAG TPA: DUF1722 domain-containing protein [Deltaproteobacteria bacterium]|nr:DUF1722 domain-containing protein [Deltaproteobacteria bacterium]